MAGPRPLHLRAAASAAGPGDGGARPEAGRHPVGRAGNVWLEGNSILYAGGRYDRNLALARLGVLPFFLLATLVVFAWARRLGGAPAAVCAVLLFTTLPPVLAHAGIATTDMAVTATIALAALLPDPLAGAAHPRRAASSSGSRWAWRCSPSSPPCSSCRPPAVAVALCRRGERRASEAGPGTEPRDQAPADLRGRPAHRLGRLSVRRGPARGAARPRPRSSRSRAAAPALDRLARAPVFPAPALFEGLGQLAAKNRAGHKSYLLGEVRHHRLVVLLPGGAGGEDAVALPAARRGVGLAAVVARLLRAPSGGGGSEPAAIALAILLVCLPSRINIGLRHVLPMYPFLAIVAGMGAGRAVARAAQACPPPERWPSCWSAGSSSPRPGRIRTISPTSTSWPGRHPERILVDSDLDDGQDLKRLADTLRARRIPAVSLAYAGSATVAEHGLPPIRWLEPHRPVTGWVAASLYSLKLGSLDRPGHDDFAWLERYRPVALVGRSIRLYYVPRGDSAATADLPSPRLDAAAAP